MKTCIIVTVLVIALDLLWLLVGKISSLIDEKYEEIINEKN